MKHSAINRPLAAAIVGLMTLAVPSAQAGALYSQPYDGTSPGAPSQMFPDFTAFSTLAFDDFTIAPGTTWVVSGVTVFGQEQGDPTQNIGVFLQFQMTALPNFNDATAPIYSGSEDTSANLNFTGQNITLGPGTYWITAWVQRPELSTGGQWFWSETNSGNPIGNEFYIQNPGGGLLGGLAVDATPGSVVYGQPPADLAFTIFGQAVPEPSSIVLLGAGAGGLLVFRRRRAAG